jgi:hypothetical protein
MENEISMLNVHNLINNYIFLLFGFLLLAKKGEAKEEEEEANGISNIYFMS